MRRRTYFPTNKQTQLSLTSTPAININPKWIVKKAGKKELTATSNEYAYSTRESDNWEFGEVGIKSLLERVWRIRAIAREDNMKSPVLLAFLFVCSFIVVSGTSFWGNGDQDE